MRASHTPEAGIQANIVRRLNPELLVAKMALVVSMGALAIGSQEARANIGRPILPVPPVEITASPKGCSTLRLDGLHTIMGGKTCDKDGAKATTIDHGYPRFGWIYSAVYIDGITKCAYIEKGKLPQREPAPGVITECRGYLNGIRGFQFITRPNCGFILGVDACKNGTYQSPVTPGCQSKGVVYSQYATRVKSPLNVFAVDAPTFSRPLSATRHETVNYRAEYDVPGQKKTAIAVNSSSGWGVMPPNCVAQNHRYGGDCKVNSRNKDENGNTVCGNADEVRKDAKKWRKIFRKHRNSPDNILQNG